MASKWGSFLSSVESRLDNILLDDETKSQQQRSASPAKAAATSTAASGAASTVPGATPRDGSPARAAAPSKAQERLNERLARAMANKGTGAKKDGAVFSDIPSRTSSPVGQLSRPSSSDGPKVDAVSAPASSITSYPSASAIESTAEIEKSIAQPMDAEAGLPGRTSIDSQPPASMETSLDLASMEILPEKEQAPQINGAEAANGTAANDEMVQQLKAEAEAAELRRQDEVRDYMERIDTLHAKLQYLTKEATEAAKKASAEAGFGSPEQKLAAKDEKIALLIEEGQRLSQTELKHMTLIKKLRAKSSEDDKAVNDAKRSSEKHEKTARDAQGKAQRAVSGEKRALEQVKTLAKLEKEKTALQAEAASQSSLIQDLQLRLSEATSAAKLAEEKAQAEVLETERQRARELSDELASLRVEKEIAEREHQKTVRESRERDERERERARVAEVEKQGELSILESKLEAFRARAEEASAGQGGDVQAKLLRQIETLQNQYAVASENWQGIEGSLLSRVAALEKERDETARKESDIRRKAREANSKVKRLDDQLESMTSKVQDLEAEKSSRAAQQAALQERLQRADAAVEEARSELKAEREAQEIRMAQRIEEERTRAKEEALRSPPPTQDTFFPAMRTESPVQHMQVRTRETSFTGDHAGAQSRRPNLQTLGIVGSGQSSTDRLSSRRSSFQPQPYSGYSVREEYSSGAGTPRRLERTDSTSTVPAVGASHGIPETPSIDYDDDKHTQGDYDFFAGMHTPATPPERASALNDVMSASTAAAGPSVQLVERMSAAVRRLESEKATHKDDLLRLSQQRDEAREQVVELMRSNQEKKAADDQLTKAQTDLKELQARHETTLEMLGEKSERVEELMADVADLKVMMREMVVERVDKAR